MPDNKVSPATEFTNMIEALYTKPHANIAIINAGIQKASLGYHLIKNYYLLLVAKAKVISVDPDGGIKITLDFTKLTAWEKEAMIQHAFMIDELATRVMSMSPRAHAANRSIIDRFNLGTMSTTITQIPGLESLEGEKKRKPEEPSSVGDYL